MAQTDLASFHQLVLQDTALQEALRKTVERERFVALMLQLGQERGYNFTAEEVEAALQAARRSWMERWI